MLLQSFFTFCSNENTLLPCNMIIIIMFLLKCEIRVKNVPTINQHAKYGSILLFGYLTKMREKKNQTMSFFFWIKVIFILFTLLMSRLLITPINPPPKFQQLCSTIKCVKRPLTNENKFHNYKIFYRPNKHLTKMPLSHLLTTTQKLMLCMLGATIVDCFFLKILKQVISKTTGPICMLMLLIWMHFHVNCKCGNDCLKF